MLTVEKPSIHDLTPRLFVHMLKNGAKAIIAQEKQINQLNVFPVSDHDTGTNIGSLMRFILVTDFKGTNFGDLFREVADCSLMGAAGNSGIILAAFFGGLVTIAPSKKETLSLDEFLACLHAAVESAYRAVSAPVEGTILTVMREWVRKMAQVCPNAQSVQQLFLLSFPAAEKAMRHTEEQLDILKESHVVDAGAYAFLLLIKGMTESLEMREEVVDVTIQDVSGVDQPIHHTSELQSKYRYCFETVLLNDGHQHDDLKQLLHPYGDSLVVNQSPSYIKVHLHTDAVVNVTEVLQQYGTILHQKVDDMHKQYAITHQRKYKIAVLTDSTANLPDDFIEAEQVHVMPVWVHLGEHHLLDNLTIQLPMLYKMLAERSDIQAKTAVPSGELIYRQLSYLADHYDGVVVLTISSKLSSMYEAVAQQAKKIDRVPIQVFDTQNTSAGQGFLVMEAVRCVAEGGDVNAIIKRLEETRNKIKLYVVINNFDTVVRSGRVTRLVGAMAKLTQIKPLLSIDNHGKTKISAVTFSHNAALDKLISKVRNFLAQHKRAKFYIVHSSAPNRVAALQKRLEYEFGIVAPEVLEASAGLGLHAGQGCVAIAMLAEG